jgi:hypothetical protein
VTDEHDGSHVVVQPTEPGEKGIRVERVELGLLRDLEIGTERGEDGGQRLSGTERRRAQHEPRGFDGGQMRGDHRRPTGAARG